MCLIHLALLSTRSWVLTLLMVAFQFTGVQEEQISWKVAFILTFAHAYQHLGFQFVIYMLVCLISLSDITFWYAIVILIYSKFEFLNYLQVGTLNGTGQTYRGHFSIWLTDEIQDRYEYLDDVLISSPQVTGWVNGSLYKQTSEVSGILPIPEDIHQHSGMAKFVPLPPDNKKQHHQYSGSKTRCLKACPSNTHKRRVTLLSKAHA